MWKLWSRAPIPPTYNATRGFIAAIVPGTSSVRRTVVDAWIARVSSERPDRAAPFSNVARNSDALAGERPMGIQPSATSAASATFAPGAIDAAPVVASGGGTPAASTG